MKLTRSRLLVFPLACLAALAMLFVSEGSYWRSMDTLDRLGEMRQSSMNIQRLAQAVLDAETAQRGYFLSSRKEYLRPYDRALDHIGSSFKFLGVYCADDKAATELLGRLRAATDTRLSELAETIRLHDEGKTESATELILTNIGQERMDEIQTLVAELMAYERSKVTAGRAELYRILAIGRAGMAALSAISLLALFLFLRQARAAQRHQQELKLAAQAEASRLEGDVRLRTAQLTRLTQHLQTAREDERARLARNLHDELGGLLTSAKLDAARIKSRLADTAPEAQERLVHLVETLNSSIALGRRIIEDLRPSTLDNLGLVPTLEILAREFEASSGIAVLCELNPVTLGAAQELVVYRLVQESITNITKYAQASHVWIALHKQDDHVQVSVRDDGIGFDLDSKLNSTYGLVGMRFRVEAEGGTLNVRSAPGQGTAIEVTLPVVAGGTA